MQLFPSVLISLWSPGELTSWGTLLLLLQRDDDEEEGDSYYDDDDDHHVMI